MWVGPIIEFVVEIPLLHGVKAAVNYKFFQTFSGLRQPIVHNPDGTTMIIDQVDEISTARLRDVIRIR